MVSTQIGTSAVGAAAVHTGGGIRSLARSVHNLLQKWRARENERAFLATLHEFQLQDMGLTLEDRQRETNKPFWRA
jgi:uncharacterized protein YjiS (DUF1127 family)